ncbi:hypothetical protein R1sor_020914 [Riccia sorocarpa]|uniref:Uncharacterized protein n=1 Tax=Riccia sorocarpa TaxID=122646 RepID=A0ABD3GFK8_9MARC
MMTSLLYSQEINGGPAHTCHRARDPTADFDPGRIIPKSSEFNKKRTKTTLPDISRNLQHDFGGIDSSDSDPSGHLSGSGSSPSSDSEDSTDFSPIKIAEKDLGLSPLRLLPGFAASIKKRKQFLASMSPPRELFSQFPALAPVGNAETEEHEENAQDENEDDGLFASEALSDSEEDKSPEHVLVTGRRFKETLREEKPPRVQLHADGKYLLPNNFTKKEVYDHYMTDMVHVRECLQDSSFKHYWVKFYPLVTIPTTNKFSVCDFCELYKSKRDKSVTRIEKAEAVEALKLHMKQQAEERAAAGRRRWKALDSPKDCAYIQIDGMDQKKIVLPHFSKQPKSVDGAALVRVHLVGAMIFHGKLHTLGVRDIMHLDGSRAILASEQVPLKSYAEIKRQTRLVQNIGPLIGRQEGEAVRHVQAIRQDIQTHCYPFFDIEQKDWWNHWFVQQEEIGRNISNNRLERLVGDMCWFWPVPPERDEHAIDELVAVTTTEEFRRRIF